MSRQALAALVVVPKFPRLGLSDAIMGYGYYHGESVKFVTQLFPHQSQTFFLPTSLSPTTPN